MTKILEEAMVEMTTPSQGEWFTVGDRDVVASSTRALLMKGERKRKKKSFLPFFIVKGGAQ